MEALLFMRYYLMSVVKNWEEQVFERKKQRARQDFESFLYFLVHGYSITHWTKHLPSLMD